MPKLGLSLVAAALAVAATRQPQAEPAPAPVVDSAEEAQVLASTLDAIALARSVASGEWSEARDPMGKALREAVVEEARFQLLTPDDAFRDDCSGFVSSVYSAVGVPMDGVVASIWDIAVVNEALHWRRRPTPGDLIFFDDTHDRNKNGRLDDALTHIGLVLDVDAAGTITFAHAGLSKGRRLGHMNLFRPGDRVDQDGKPLNDPLRMKTRWDPSDAPGLTGELWVGFASVDPEVDWLTWEKWVPLR
ncbi:MAG: hypothetical protein H6741_20315 [Alphaproteobacteria bacterium]|nr:hypothetical protein [Alphaproteobacteria bacterium]